MKIAFTSFGGMSMIPLINEQMLSRGWMTQTEVLDIVAIAEMTPGPIGVNCATFAGIRVAGLAGALAANLGALVPTLTIALAAAVFFEKFKENKRVQDALYGVRPMTVGIIAAALITLGQTNFIVDSQLYLPSIIIAAITTFTVLKFKLSVPLTVLLSALLGLAIVR